MKEGKKESFLIQERAKCILSNVHSIYIYIDLKGFRKVYMMYGSRLINGSPCNQRVQRGRRQLTRVAPSLFPLSKERINAIFRNFRMSKHFYRIYPNNKPLTTMHTFENHAMNKTPTFIIYFRETLILQKIQPEILLNPNIKVPIACMSLMNIIFIFIYQ